MRGEKWLNVYTVREQFREATRLAAIKSNDWMVAYSEWMRTIIPSSLPLWWRRWRWRVSIATLCLPINVTVFCVCVFGSLTTPNNIHLGDTCLCCSSGGGGGGWKSTQNLPPNEGGWLGKRRCSGISWIYCTPSWAPFGNCCWSWWAFLNHRRHDNSGAQLGKSCAHRHRQKATLPIRAIFQSKLVQRVVGGEVHCHTIFFFFSTSIQHQQQQSQSRRDPFNANRNTEAESCVEEEEEK